MAVKRKMFLLFCLYPFVLAVLDCLLIDGCFEVHIHHWFSHAPHGLCADWMDRALGRCWHKQTQADVTPVWEVTRFESWKQTHSNSNEGSHKGVRFFFFAAHNAMAPYQVHNVSLGIQAYRDARTDAGCMCATFCILKVTSALNVAWEQVCLQERG